MLRGAVGAGDSLLLLLGDGDESKGTSSIPRLLFLAARSAARSAPARSPRSVQHKASLFLLSGFFFFLSFCLYFCSISFFYKVGRCFKNAIEIERGSLPSVGRH